MPSSGKIAWSLEWYGATHSPPSSFGSPPISVFQSRPPTRSRASRTTTLLPAATTCAAAANLRLQLRQPRIGFDRRASTLPSPAPQRPQRGLCARHPPCSPRPTDRSHTRRRADRAFRATGPPEARLQATSASCTRACRDRSPRAGGTSGVGQPPPLRTSVRAPHAERARGRPPRSRAASDPLRRNQPGEHARTLRPSRRDELLPF